MDTDTINEAFVFIIRETGWTLEYIRKLPFDILAEIVEELRYQKAMDDYKNAYNSAMIITALLCSDKKTITPQDIVGEPPKRRIHENQFSQNT